jgi:CheY-like chemotaxis protein
MAEEPGKDKSAEAGNVKPADKGQDKAEDQEKAEADAAAEQQPLSEYLSARNFLLWASVIGVALPFVFAAQSPSLTVFATVSAVGIGTLVASMAAGGLLGFLFGIPTSLQSTATPPPPTDGQAGTGPGGGPAPRYAGNTSLEQISDWLTKILVGVGLTQLAAIPTALTSLGDFLADGLGNLPGANVFAPLLVVFALLDGFFLSYLWTRLNLGSLLAQSDVNQRVSAAERKGVIRGKEQAAKAALVDATAAVKEIQPTPTRAPTTLREVLWVDDNPDYNTNERQAIRNLWRDVQFELVRSTDDALGLLANQSRFAFVITDMSRPGDRTAGLTLLRKMRDAGITLPVIIYAASASQAREAEAISLGAKGMTNSPNRLIQLVGEVMREQGAAEQTKP